MALTEKKRKKLNRFIVGTGEKLNLVFLELTIQYSAILLIDLLWDNICWMFLWHYNKGIGGAQIIIAIFCIFQIYRYAKLVKKG